MILDKLITKRRLERYDQKIKEYIAAQTGGGSKTIGWGVAKTGQVSLSSTTAVTVDISDLGFTSADEYEVYATMNDTATTAYTPKVFNKTATSFQIRKSGSGNNIACGYVVIGAGYGGGLTYRDMVIDGGMSDTSENAVQNKAVKQYVDNIASTLSFDAALNTESTNGVQNKAVAEAVNNLQYQINGLGEPFRVKQFKTNFDITLPVCTSDVGNTSIPNIDFAIDDTEGAEYQIVGMIAYEVFDAANSSGSRINCWPVCQFTMNTQKTLRIRMMCAGTAGKNAKSINAWVLLKHRE